ncbi:ATP-binding protein [Geomonas oryzisoli]|uniref:ATP-binding protein n=1 Tax=Geomonas oryzisoli TaxID=2847992 RepID=A0ABX8J1F5_9BACT|nr:ATP-binding protein [Geomonas oryzisoli]QWV92108.1 ATP-binding protein [Geomonas oryzisoli]
MKVAFTGSSSTGKTTLALRLQTDPRFCILLPAFITVDARRILAERGFGSMDRMQPEELRSFQHAYLERKLALENGRDGYFTDRSFIDLAAYWLERDAAGLPASEVEAFVEICRHEANRYDLHVYFPYGLIPFESDGYRSEDEIFHQRINSRICQLLHDWGHRVVRLNAIDISERCDAVIGTLQEIGT